MRKWLRVEGQSFRVWGFTPPQSLLASSGRPAGSPCPGTPALGLISQMYQFNGFRKSPSPQNRQLSNSKQQADDFVGEMTF